MEHLYRTAGEAAARLLPESPLYLYRRHVLERSVRCFTSSFPGAVLYAVKTNPSPETLKDIYAAGVRHFDVASLAEIETVRGLFGDKAALYYMHPVKSRRSVRAAYYEYGIRCFALDSPEELEKILEETGNARDLTLMARIAIPNSYAKLALCEKFGACRDSAPALLRSAREKAAKLGVCFHVGSQCMHPESYTIAIQQTAELLEEAGVSIDALDVGGGFPSVYPGMEPPPLRDYFITIQEAVSRAFPQGGITVLGEPGRALVAESGSLIVRVERRKGNALYINDGTYGALFDAGTPRFIFPARRVLRAGGGACGAAQTTPYRFFGPTCDSLDVMEGPFYLPADMREGDYIEIGQLGAYARTMVTGFNGFHPHPDAVYVQDEPMMRHAFAEAAAAA